MRVDRLPPVRAVVRGASSAPSVRRCVCTILFRRWTLADDSQNRELEPISLIERSRTEMPTVETAKGPVETRKLGKVLMHEHVFIISTEIAQNYPEEWGDEEKRLADAVVRLNELKQAGIDTILDPTALGSRPLHSAHQERGRPDRSEHHRRDRSLHVRRAAALLQHARRRLHDADVRARHPAKASPTPASRPASSSAPPTSRA